MSSVDPDEFARLLDTVDEILGDRTPATKAFVQTLRTRMRLAEEDASQPGLTVETLACDLISILSYLETRVPPE